MRSLYCHLNLQLLKIVRNVVCKGIVIVQQENVHPFFGLKLVNLHKEKPVKKAISIPGAPAPIGPYSQAIVQGNMCFVSGQIPMNPQTGELVLQSVDEATKRVMQNIQALLEEAGFSLENVVKCSIFLKDLNDFTSVNEVYGSFFQGLAPSRETVQVARLPLDVPIEISCIAMR